MSKPIITEIARNLGFTEGPIVSPDGTIYVTSITHGKVYALGDGARVHADTGGGANGAALDVNGNLYVAQNGGRFAGDGPAWSADSVGGIQRVSHDGAVEWVNRDPIAPNDLCFGPDGLIYVTDPTRAPGSADGRLWRVDPEHGTAELLRSVPWFPNGIAFGPDDRLYVASTDTAQVLRFEVSKQGLTGESVVIRMRTGRPDGIAFDSDGNIVVAALARDAEYGAIQTWSPGGDLIDTFGPGSGHLYTNIAFGRDRQLVITDSENGLVLLADGWSAAGLALYPFRR